MAATGIVDGSWSISLASKAAVMRQPTPGRKVACMVGDKGDCRLLPPQTSAGHGSKGHESSIVLLLSVNMCLLPGPRPLSRVGLIWWDRAQVSAPLFVSSIDLRFREVGCGRWFFRELSQETACIHTSQTVRVRGPASGTVCARACMNQKVSLKFASVRRFNGVGVRAPV